MSVICFAFPEGTDRQLVGDIFYRYTPQMAWRGREAIFLDVSQCQRLQSTTGVLNRCRAHLRTLEIPCRYAVAEQPPTALALALYQKQERSELPIEALRYFAMPFQGHDAVEKHLAVLLTHLQRLGVETIGDFERIQTPGLIARFGSLGWLLAQNLKPDAQFIWPLYRPSEKIVETVEFDVECPVETTEPLIFYLKSIVERLFLRLRGRGQRLKAMCLRLEPEFGSQESDRYEVPIYLANGILTTQSIFRIVRERLEYEVRVRPLRQRVAALSLEVVETTPYRDSQRDLFYPKKQEEEEEYVQLVSRLRTRIGEKSVFVAQPVQSFIPEYNWIRKHMPEQVAETESPVPLRPLRLLMRPVKVTMIQSTLSWSGQKIYFHDLADREVVLSEWWNDIPERIYFRASVKNGQELWLFRSRDGVFIHGFFD